MALSAEDFIAQQRYDHMVSAAQAAGVPMRRHTNTELYQLFAKEIAEGLARDEENIAEAELLREQYPEGPPFEIEVGRPLLRYPSTTRSCHLHCWMDGYAIIGLGRLVEAECCARAYRPTLSMPVWRWAQAARIRCRPALRLGRGIASASA
ncbi:hypothetical protein [Belnapia sp. F-4-1]|uniref:hypothetical protein n=1 Tax=Belnapia sp. F-4-1 TaxID=1545443 RepID=UPI0005BA7623|nr:hypothetical protein [Belnapia sp. F-4-1]